MNPYFRDEIMQFKGLKVERFQVLLNKEADRAHFRPSKQPIICSLPLTETIFKFSAGHFEQYFDDFNIVYFWLYYL